MHGIIDVQATTVRPAVAESGRSERARSGYVRSALVAAGVWVAACVAGSMVQAQPAPKPEIPEPEDISLTTTDKVKLVCTVYRPQKEGKEVVPVVVIHDHKGQRTSFDGFARLLQQEGHFVIAPDLRGHGDSVKATDFSGSEKVLKPEILNAGAFDVTFMRDMEAVKKELMERNNAGKLNVEKLCVIGADYGAVVAVAYTAWDWHFPSQAFKKNGQDVKALVLISPRVNHSLVPRDRGILQAYAQRTFPKAISTMIVCGEGTPEYLRDSKSINEEFTKNHWKEPKSATSEEIAKNKDLFLDTYKTKLQGTKMLGADLGLERRVIAFIRLRLVEQTIPWTDRKSSLGQAPSGGGAGGLGR